MQCLISICRPRE
uniref:Uncharacterized protein n=1 Tax=Anguilla anguilla TaxID=7936 RepID=A0A0E9TT76_ANGAN